MKVFRLALLAALPLLTQCHHTDPGPADPAAQLPPATQSGAHTFGCLLNGQPWTPTTGTLDNNYKLVYDPTYAGGDLEIRIRRVSTTIDQYFLIASTQVKKTGIYPLDGITGGVYYSTGIKGPCYEYDNSTSAKVQGQLTVTRLDQSAGIVAGTFAFKLWQPGCDTVKVTQGRFDYNL